MVKDFFAEDKASGVTFCMAVHRRPGQGISHFEELCFPRSPKSDESDESASVRATRAGPRAGPPWPAASATRALDQCQRAGHA